MGCLLSSFLLSLCVGERKDGDDEVEVRLGSNDDEVLLVASSFLVSRFTTASVTSRSVDPLRKTSTALPHLCMFSVFLSLKLVSAQASERALVLLASASLNAKGGDGACGGHFIQSFLALLPLHLPYYDAPPSSSATSRRRRRH